MYLLSIFTYTIVTFAIFINLNNFLKENLLNYKIIIQS